MKYHNEEGQTVKVQDFNIKTCFAGYKRFVAHVLLQNSIMKMQGEGLVTSFLVNSGASCSYVHESVLKSLQNTGYDAYTCDQKVTLSSIPKTDPFEGYNLMGMNALRQLGIQCSGAVHNEFLLDYEGVEYEQGQIEIKSFYKV